MIVKKTERECFCVCSWLSSVPMENAVCFSIGLNTSPLHNTRMINSRLAGCEYKLATFVILMGTPPKWLPSRRGERGFRQAAFVVEYRGDCGAAQIKRSKEMCRVTRSRKLISACIVLGVVISERVVSLPVLVRNNTGATPPCNEPIGYVVPFL